MTKLTFRSREADYDIYAPTCERAERALRETLGETFGALESGVRAGASVYSVEAHRATPARVDAIVRHAFGRREVEEIAYSKPLAS